MINVTPIPIFKDNYVWLLTPSNPTSSWAIAVDPGDAEPVLATLKKLGCQLAAIFITHHHWDHTNGIDDLLDHFNTAKVYGAYNSPVNSITNRLNDGDTFELPDNTGQCYVISTPGHTIDHISYLIDKHLFCGDTLFSAGCGRLFEGDAAQMHASLNKLSHLPTNTYVYPTHEYTLSNLKFAKEADANNPAVSQRIDEVKKLRDDNQPSLPTTIALEREINPFLRCTDTGVQYCVEQEIQKKLNSELEVFTELRRWKDHF